MSYTAGTQHCYYHCTPWDQYCLIVLVYITVTVTVTPLDQHCLTLMVHDPVTAHVVYAPVYDTN